MYSTATKAAAQTTEDLAKHDMENKKDNVKREAVRTIEKTVEQVSDYANNAGRYVRDFVDNAANRLDETNKLVTSEVKESPIKAVLIASGVGFILGSLLRRR